MSRPLAWKEAESGCWEVTSHARNNRHGYVIVRGELAHRRIWEEAYGPIPFDCCVLHHCDNRICVNPEHLFLGTYSDNAQDRENKGRGFDGRGEKNGYAKLTEEQVREIKKLYHPGNGVLLATKFGVSQGAISHIIMGRVWNWMA